MFRFLRIFVSILAVVVAAAGVTLHFANRDKKDAPVIVCSTEDMITVSVAVTDEELLGFVTASDKQDGDLTSEIVVSRKTYFIGPKVSTITYSVCDSDNNIASLSKNIFYSDYKSPEIKLLNEFIFPSGYNFDLGRYVEATDVIDGNLSDYVKVISSEFTNVSGQYKVNIKVSNSLADCTDITINAIVTDEDYSQVRIVLDTYTSYITVGQTIDYKALVKDVVNKRETYYDADDIIIDDSSVDLSKPGVYDVFYRIPRSKYEPEENATLSRLIVVVREDVKQ